MRRIAACLGLAAALGLVAAPAQARFQPVTQPPGGGVLAFGASGSTWLAITSGGNGVKPYRSVDAGANWLEVPINGVQDPQPGNAVAVGPDGSFWLPVQEGFT